MTPGTERPCDFYARPEETISPPAWQLHSLFPPIRIIRTSWLGEAIRPTKDIDLLGLGDTSAEALRDVFVALCGVSAPEDGLTCLADTVRVEAIRDGQEYGGMGVTLMAMLGNVRIPLQPRDAGSSHTTLAGRDAPARS